MKAIYESDTEELAMEALMAFADKWQHKYPMIAKSWERNWQQITPFLHYPKPIRKAIYTTNVIEASNRQVRKIIKTKGSFPNDEAVYKIVFLALQNAQIKWTMPIRDWPLALNQFHICFQDRCNL